MDLLSEYLRPFNLFERLLDLRPRYAFSFYVNGPGASGSMQCHSLFADSFVFHDLTRLSSRDISGCKRIPSFSFLFGIRPCTKVVFMQFHGSSVLIAKYEYTFLILRSFQSEKHLSFSTLQYYVINDQMKALLQFVYLNFLACQSRRLGLFACCFAFVPCCWFAVEIAPDVRRFTRVLLCHCWRE
jgi:hypothetical protein